MKNGKNLPKKILGLTLFWKLLEIQMVLNTTEKEEAKLLTEKLKVDLNV